MKAFISSFILLCLMGTGVFTQHEHPDVKGMKETMPADSEEVIQVMNTFRMAIINNNQEKASGLLTEDAQILESGGIETKEEYLSHHFHSDGKFLSAMPRDVQSQKVKSTDHTAWVSTISHIYGTYNDKDISISSAELAVLVKTNAGWKIASLHWSSRDAK